MAQFRIGQRVKVIAASPSQYAHMNGLEGVICAPLFGGWEYGVDFGRLVMGAWAPAQVFGFDGNELAPLTDPSAERFLESLKKLGREPMPTKERV